MGDSTTPSANVPGRENRQLNISVVIAVVAAATAIAALVISVLQVNVASSQNTAAQQQQLASLTTAIANQFVQTRTEAVTADLEVEGQTGAVIINDLNGDGVANIEYVQVGRSLNDSGNTAEALTYFEDAVNAPPYDAESQALALRNLGVVYYSLDQPVTAHRDMMQAVKVFSGHPVEPQGYEANTIAQGYLLDAEYQIPIKGSCSVIASDIAAAEKVLGSYPENTLDLGLMNTDEKGYQSECRGKV